jgi:hypothetical protein
MELVLVLTISNIVLTLITLNSLLEAKDTLHKLYGFAESVRKRPRG